jgi:hypothetical protein
MPSRKIIGIGKRSRMAFGPSSQPTPTSKKVYNMKMTVAEVMGLLEGQNPDAIVVMAGDEEGNYYSTISGIEGDLYMNDDGDVGYNTMNQELRDEGYTDDDLVVGEPCVVLYP